MQSSKETSYRVFDDIVEQIVYPENWECYVEVWIGYGISGKQYVAQD
jgi:hypothetical protein